jgi:hypothetical protein
MGRRLAQFLEVNPEIVLRIVVELPEMRAALETPCDATAIGERQYRQRPHRQRLAVDLVAPAAAFHS